MRKREILFVSAFLSFLVHAAFLAVAYYIWVPGTSLAARETPKLFRVSQTDLSQEPGQEINLREDYQNYVEQLRFEGPSNEAEEFVSADVMKPKKIARPETEQFFTKPESFKLEQAPEPVFDTNQNLPPVLLETKPLANLEVKNNPAPAPIEKAKLPTGSKSDSLKETRPTLDLITPPSAIAPGQSKILVPKELAQGLMGLLEPQGSTGSSNASSGRKSNLQNALENMASEHAFSPTPSYESLDEFLGVYLYIYRDPSDGQGYYQLSIYPKPEAPSIEVMPKEMLFLVDASLSIKYKRLSGFKNGIQYALERLNQKDLFNVFVFKNTVVPLGNRSLRPEPSTLVESIRFLQRLQPSQTTDIYQALHDTIQKSPALNPSYIILMTDGKATEGIRSTAGLISKITRFNQLKRPIFTFSGGADVDRFLLDFLAYPNRAWTEYTDKDENIATSFAEFYDKIRNPILVNVRYQITPLDPAEIYPHNLPDFYKDTLFTLYGRFDQESKFSIRITGEIEQKKKEFIFANTFKNASTGSRNIAKAWAFNKIYHLISRMTLEGPNTKDKEEIKRLAQKFELNMPYDMNEIFPG